MKEDNKETFYISAYEEVEHNFEVSKEVKEKFEEMEEDFQSEEDIFSFLESNNENDDVYYKQRISNISLKI